VLLVPLELLGLLVLPAKLGRLDHKALLDLKALLEPKGQPEHKVRLDLKARPAHKDQRA
jgi:hypothetical protein